MKSAVVMRSLPIDRSWKLILAAVFVCFLLPVESTVSRTDFALKKCLCGLAD